MLLGRVSPPFLDFIESSGVTTQWMSLTEMLRGTDVWTPFVAPNATAGASLVTGSVAVLATTLVAAAGLAGLAMRSMPARGRLVTILLVGVAVLAVGYSGGLGSPVALEVQAFLDAAGTPLRNIHKLEPLLRLPIALGLAHLLSRIPLPGSAPRDVWTNAFAHPERDKRVAVGIVVLVALTAATSLAWTGRLTPPGAFDAIPQYWHDTADWLDEHNDGGRVLVAPGAPFATQVWGSSHDEPLQVLGDSAWGVRDSIPLTPPETIRALDSVQRLFAAGRPSAGLADTLARQGISYVVVRNDLDPETSRSARPVLVHRAIDGSPGLEKVAQFGDPVGPGTLAGFITDSGLRPRYPAVEIYRVNRALDAGGAVPRRHRRDGARRRRTRGAAAARRETPPARAATAGSDAAHRGRAGGRAARSRGHRDRHPAGPRNRLRPRRRPLVGDPNARRHAAHLQPRDGLSDSRAPTPSTGSGPADVCRCRVRRRIRPRCPTSRPRPAPAAAIDGDSSTSWVSSALQSAIGQWLQVDFDHPVTNATITITPSATAVGAQVRRIEVSTVNGTSTLRFDEAGKPLTAALPYGESPWVRITAVATDDGSPGVQFGITDFAVTQYDANGFAHPVSLRHTVSVPGPPPDSAVAQWDLGSELLGRPGCAQSPDGIRCAAAMALSPEEPVNLSRTLTVPEPTAVTPTVWVRARQGPNLADLVSAPGSARATGDADPIDVLGSAYAAADGDPDTAWTAPQGVVQHRAAPTLTLKLPVRREVAAVRVTPSSSELPAHPTLVAVDLGDGPQVRRLTGDGGAQTLDLKPRITDTVKVSILDWDDIIDRTALGFDQLKPPGLAEVTALDARGAPIAAADAARNRARSIELPCGRGPIIGVAGQFVQTSISTTVGALLDGDPVPARPCQEGPIMLPAGQQELLISPGAAFIADGVQLAGPLAGRIRPAATVPAQTGTWSTGRSRGERARVGDVAGAGRPREHQPRLDRTPRRRHAADTGHGQRLAAGLGAAAGHGRTPSHSPSRRTRSIAPG